MVSVQLVPERKRPPWCRLPNGQPVSFFLKFDFSLEGAVYLHDDPLRKLTDSELRFLLRRKQPLEEKNGRYVMFPLEEKAEKVIAVRQMATALARVRMHADPETPTVVAVHLYGLNKRKP